MFYTTTAPSGKSALRVLTRDADFDESPWRQFQKVYTAEKLKGYAMRRN
jgi:hypothetical protein